jgi:hypothetical protein
MNKWIGFVLGFSLAVNVTVLGTVVFLWKNPLLTSPQNTDFCTPLMTTDGMGDNNVILMQKKTGELETVFHKRVEYQQDLDSVQHEIIGCREKIIVLLLQEPPDKKTIHIKVAELADNQIEAEVLTIDHLLDIRPLLPQNQWRSLVTNLAQGREHEITIKHDIQIEEFEWVPENEHDQIRRKIIIEKQNN